MFEIVLLSLAEPEAGGCGGGCGDAGSDATAESSASTPGSCASTPQSCGNEHPADRPRVPVLHCADALRAAGARVDMVTARSDAEIDSVLARLDGAARADGLTWPDPDGKTRLVAAVTSDAQLRHVLRRMVRRYAPAPSKRPADMPVGRTVPDLPVLGVLPLEPAGAAVTTDLLGQLGLPRRPAEVAAAVLGERVRRLDLLRHDGGSVTLDGVLVGGVDDQGRALPWRGRVEVDDAVLTDGADPLLAAAVGNAGGVARLDGLPLLLDPDPADGSIEVAVAVPVTHKPLFGRARIRIEVRRARGRAVSIAAHGGDVPIVDDGVVGVLTRKRSWWVEPGAWGVFTN